MRKIRVAQIGINEYSHGRDIFNTLKVLSDEYEIVGYALVENEKEKFAHILSVFDGYKELTLDEILTDPTIEAVTIETEEIHLTKYARLAAENGKHIHIEKPGGICFADFEEMLSAVEKGNKTFHVGYMYRYNPAIIDLLTKIKRGELGEIICVEGVVTGKNPEPEAFDELHNSKKSKSKPWREATIPLPMGEIKVAVVSGGGTVRYPFP